MKQPGAPALSGIRILDLGTFIAAPFAATVLSEFGAEVIKVEKPQGGDPLRRFGTPSRAADTLCWMSEARNKRSITLDLRRPQGAAILRQLVRRCDVVCESFRPGTLEGWGIGFEVLLQENPQLTMLRVSGFGQTGPLKDRPGFARIAHAFAGLAHLTGMPDGAPLTPGSTSLADYISGLYGAIGILLALRARDRVGGQCIDVALFESIFRVLDDLAPAYAQDGTVRGRQGMGTSVACPHGHFICADDRWIALACSSDKVFARFATMIGRAELAMEDAYGRVERRLAARAHVEALASEWAAARTMAAAMSECNAAGVPCAPVQTVADIFADEQFAAREVLVARQHPGAGEVVVPNVLPRLSRTPGSVRHLGPQLGEANHYVYRELLGLSEQDVCDLQESAVI
jgi:crotonobetainyl-CoA:carnitine CoA-transferase CaiB-like acyl-CoA transferase